MVNETVRKLQEMRLSVMAKTYMDQMEHPEEFESMTFDERFSLIVDRESDVRLNTKLKKLITSAKFPSNTADMEDILYWPDRRLNRDLIQMLRTNAYIDKKRNVMFLGPTGSGKTFLANALGINACRGGYKVLYLRLPDFFAEYAEAEAKTAQLDLMKKYQKIKMLILDEFLLIPINELQQRMLLELLERRWGQSATIFCSQFDIPGWHSQLGGGAVADAIMDRIIPGSYKMKLEGDVSIRQRMAEMEEA